MLEGVQKCHQVLLMADLELLTDVKAMRLDATLGKAEEPGDLMALEVKPQQRAHLRLSWCKPRKLLVKLFGELRMHRRKLRLKLLPVDLLARQLFKFILDLFPTWIGSRIFSHDL